MKSTRELERFINTITPQPTKKERIIEFLADWLLPIVGGIFTPLNLIIIIAIVQMHLN